MTTNSSILVTHSGCGTKGSSALCFPNKKDTKEFFSGVNREKEKCSGSLGEPKGTGEYVPREVRSVFLVSELRFGKEKS